MKQDSPSSAVVEDAPEEGPTVHQELLPPPKLDYDREPPGSPSPPEEVESAESPVREDTPSRDEVPTTQPAQTPSSQSIRAGVKRKYGEDSEAAQAATIGTGKENAVNSDIEKSFSARGSQKRRSIRDSSTNRREKSGGTRTPLAAKSTNEDVSSPRKAMKVGKTDEVKTKQGRTTKEFSVLEDTSAQRPLPSIEIPPPEPLTVATVTLDSVTALPSATPSSPSTPDRPAQKEIPHDTPPPAHISSTGETSRPTRRARVPISYAEPNLRDKMRRPTKELVDAVTGEGKFINRLTAIPRHDENHSAPTSAARAKSEPGSAASGRTKTLTADAQSKPQQRAVLSPLAQKDVFPETLPNTVITERRKRPSTVGSTGRESSGGGEKAESTNTNSLPAETTQTAGSKQKNNANTTTEKDTSDNSQKPASTAAPAPAPEPAPDIYEFVGCSPVPETKVSAASTTATNNSESKPTVAHSSSSSSTLRQRTARKSSMAAAAALRELLDEEEQEEKRAPSKSRSSSSHARKRASMAPVPKKSSILSHETEEGDSAEGADEAANLSGVSAGSDAEAPSGSGRDTRISRRRSMMP